MSLPKIPISIIIICIIFAILGGLWGAQVAGLDFKAVLSNFGLSEKPEQELGGIISPLEEENLALGETIVVLELKLAEANRQLKVLNKEISELGAEIEILQAENIKLKTIDENINNLVGYYREMKPKEIISIFENLDDEIVLKVLLKLESNQVSKILAAMEPARAAKLTKNLTDYL